MIVHGFELVIANVLFGVVGLGLLGVTGIASSRRALFRLAPLGYAVGLATTGIAAADLALVHIPIGRIGLPLVALVVFALGWWRIGPSARSEPQATRGPWTATRVVTLLPLAGVAVVFWYLARLLAVKPLVEFDGWVIWATRARALYEFGYPAAPVFTDPTYPALQHPLLLPSLEAIDFRFMGAFDGTVVHLQLLGFALVLVGGAWTLLRSRVRPLVLGVTLLAITAAPTFLYQLPSNYADIPLACFVALGVAALACWVRSGDRELAIAAAVFLGAGAVTKSEGEAFALAALIAAAIALTPARRRSILGIAATVALVDLPWRVWVAIKGVQSTDYRTSDLVNPAYLADHASRVWPAVHELTIQIATRGSFGYLVPLVGVAIVGGLLLQHRREVAFASV